MWKYSVEQNVSQTSKDKKEQAQAVVYGCRAMSQLAILI